MKTKFLLLTCVLALHGGCKQERTPAQEMDDLQTSANNNARQIKDYSFKDRPEFVAKMKSELEEMNKSLEALSARIEQSSEKVREEAKPRLQSLREELSKMNQQLDAAQNATESTWESVKAASEKGLDSVKKGFQQSRQWVSEKVAP